MSIKSMKQALEALVEVTGWTWAGPMRVMDEVEDAITALRTAISEAEGRSIEQAEKREWIGLTDEEIDDIAEFHGLDFMSYAPFTQAIEAKLRSKNT